MPAHISFNEKVKALGYSVAFNAIGIKGSIRWNIAKLRGKTADFEPSAMEAIYNQYGKLSPSHAIAAMTHPERLARETVVKSYQGYRNHLDRFAPTKGKTMMGGHRNTATSIFQTEWELYLAPGTAFDLTMQAIFKENDGRELGTETMDMSYNRIRYWKRRIDTTRIEGGTVTKRASEARVIFISSSKGAQDIKRIELHAAGQEIIAWSAAK